MLGSHGPASCQISSRSEQKGRKNNVTGMSNNMYMICNVSTYVFYWSDSCFSHTQSVSVKGDGDGDVEDSLSLILPASLAIVGLILLISAVLIILHHRNRYKSHPLPLLLNLCHIYVQQKFWKLLCFIG